MKPYLAIIQDSFAEALASRVLWILMILITVVLLSLAPLGINEQQTTLFRARDIVDARELIADLRQASDRGDNSPGNRIWDRMDPAAREELQKFQEQSEPSFAVRRRAEKQLMESLNALLEQPDLYSQAAWEEMPVGGEANELIEQGIDGLSSNDVARLNRLLIEKSFADRFQPQPPRQITISYFGAEVSPPLPISHQRATRLIEKLILPLVMKVLVGFIAILAAILVTAPIIPQMFDPGALSLLLSKPLSRSMMFLAKFAGGCAFILINVAYLIVGLWLIVGARFAVWNQGLLLCIPIFLFLFAIYYSVSAFAGVIWRNAVVSIVMTVLFWLLCTTVGGTKGVLEQFVVETRKIVRLVPAGETLIAMDQRGTTARWKSDTNEWEPVFLQNPMGPIGSVMGPIYDSENQLLMAARTWNRGFLQSGIDLELGRKEDDWAQSDGPMLPEGTFEILPDPEGRLLAATTNGIQRWVGELNQNQKKLKVFFMEIPQSVGKPFRPVGPRSTLTCAAPVAAAIDPITGSIVVFSRGTLSLLTLLDKTYQLENQIETDAEPDMGADVAMGGSTILLALSDGRILNYDAATLQLRRTDKPEPRSQPRLVRSSPDGHWFSVVFHNGRLHLLDSTQGDQGRFSLADVRGQGTISAADFSAAGQVLVADRSTRVTEYATDDLKQLRVFSPSLTALEIAYHYVVVPVYWLFPKPGELDNTVLYVLKGEETTDMGIQTGDLQAPRAQLRPWVPVRSSLLFMVVILGLACWYIERQDF